MPIRALLITVAFTSTACLEPPPEGRSPPSCADDRFEWADDGARPRLDVGHHDGLVACPGAPDRFELARPGVRWDVTVEADAPVRVTLWAGEDILQRDRATRLFFVDEAVTEIEVSGDGAAYSVTLALSMVPDSSCDGSRRAPAVLTEGAYDGQLCRTGEAFFRPQVRAGDRLEVTVAGASLTAVETFERVGDERIRTERHAVVGPVSFARTQPADGAVTLRVAGAAGAAYRVTLDTQVQDIVSVALAGRIEAGYRPVLADGLAARAVFAPAGARLDVSAEGPAGRLATARVGEDGAFSVNVLTPRDEAITVDVAADIGGQVARAGPLPPVRVSPEPDGPPWLARVFSGRPDALPSSPLVVPPDSAAEAALSVAYVAAAGLATVGPYLPAAESPPPVVYRWRPRTGESCGTCFRPGERPYIDLSGRVSDPDEWDAPVIVHELGHYLVAVFGRDDSDGGPHDGRRTTPTLAWSEGFAIFFASFATGASTQLDFKVTHVRQLDLEQLDAEAAFGTADDRLDGDVSEHLVAALLWDLLDAPTPDDDGAALSAEVLLGALFEPGPDADRGAPGFDLVDYLDRLWCRAPLDRAAIESVIEARRFPYVAPACL